MYKKYNKELTIILGVIILLMVSPFVAELIWPPAVKYFKLLFFLVASIAMLAPAFTVQIRGYLSSSKIEMFNELASKDELFNEPTKGRKVASILAAFAMAFVSIVLFLYAKNNT